VIHSPNLSDNGPVDFFNLNF